MHFAPNVIQKIAPSSKTNVPFRLRHHEACLFTDAKACISLETSVKPCPFINDKCSISRLRHHATHAFSSRLAFPHALGTSSKCDPFADAKFAFRLRHPSTLGRSPTQHMGGCAHAYKGAFLHCLTALQKLNAARSQVLHGISPRCFTMCIH